MRKTKIVCTIGPSCNSVEKLKELIKAGMNVARVNTSHGTYESNSQTIKNIIAAREELNVPLAIMLDTKGPEIRIGTFKNNEGIVLKKGQEFILSTSKCEGDEKKVFVNYSGLTKDVKVGNKILINDGLIELKVLRIIKTDIICKVISGGTLTDRKACFVPDVVLNMPFLSTQDKEDLKLAIEFNLDFVAASFVSKKEDAIAMRNYLNKIGGKTIEIIAKIESVAGVKNVKEICEHVEGIMVARGDLGVEYSLEKLPAIQKNIIDAAINKGKLLIMATEMLESMTTNIRPTRAEANDVASAVFVNCSAVMLSGETAVGKHPSLVVETMSKICIEAENSVDFDKEFTKANFNLNGITDAISHATVRCAFDIKSKNILAFTLSGKTAKRISSFRPQADILALTTSKQTYNQLAFYFGVTPMLCKTFDSTDAMFEYGKTVALKSKLVKQGDVVVISAGAPAGIPGQTNLVKLDKI